MGLGEAKGKRMQYPYNGVESHAGIISEHSPTRKIFW